MKTDRLRSADPGQAVKALLALFGAGSYMGEPYSIPGENQLRMTDAVWGLGNALPAEDAFGEALHLYAGLGLPENERIGEAFAGNRFSVACGKTDTCFMAVRGMLALMMHRHVHKFLVLVRGAAERDMLALALSAYLKQSSSGFGFGSDGPEMTVYANGESDMTGEGMGLSLLQLRRFVCAGTPQILLMNREYFNRPENLLLRPDVLLDGNTPLSMVTPARPVVVTLSDTASAVRTLLERSAVFDPLCTLSFTQTPDGTGITVPVYAPGSKTDARPEMEQITL